MNGWFAIKCRHPSNEGGSHLDEGIAFWWDDILLRSSPLPIIKSKQLCDSTHTHHTHIATSFTSIMSKGKHNHPSCILQKNKASALQETSLSQIIWHLFEHYQSNWSEYLLGRKMTWTLILIWFLCLCFRWLLFQALRWVINEYHWVHRVWLTGRKQVRL